MDCTLDRDLNLPLCAIVVMAKQPEPGKVKTRFYPPLTSEQAADLYEAFFTDTISLVSGIEKTVLFVAYDPDTALDFFTRIVSPPGKCISQGPGGSAREDILPGFCLGIQETQYPRKRYTSYPAGGYQVCNRMVGCN